jgi:hypothetical protein
MKDIPLPKKPEDIQKGVEAWLVSGHGQQKRVTIRKVKCKFSTTDTIK